MAETYCGKSCALCEEKLHQKCPGCRVGPGKRYGTECKVAKCCISRNKDSCDQCMSRNSCYTLRYKDSAPRPKSNQTEESELDLRKKYENSALLGKWLMILFWFSIGTIVVELLFGFKLADESFGVVCGAIVGVLSSAILLMLTPACWRFRIAGIMGILSAVLDTAQLFVNNQILLLLINLTALVISLVGLYQQFMGLMDVTANFDSNLADKWGNLWIANFVCLCVTGLGMLLVLLGPIGAFFAALATFAGVLGALVLSVLRMIYLYRTGNMFSRYANNITELGLNFENNT